MSSVPLFTEQNNPRRLLYTRKQAAELLGGISVFTLIRLEKEGRLKPIRLTRSATSQVYYSHDALLTLIEGGGVDSTGVAPEEGDSDAERSSK